MLCPERMKISADINEIITDGFQELPISPKSRHAQNGHHSQVILRTWYICIRIL